MMFVILVYDVGSRRVGRVRKLAGKYLHPVQRSVFEGFVSVKSLHRMQDDLERAIDPACDSVIVYCTDAPGAMTKHSIGAKTDSAVSGFV